MAEAEAHVAALCAALLLLTPAVTLRAHPLQAPLSRELMTTLEQPINEVRVSGKLRLPSGGKNVRAVTVLMRVRLSTEAYDDPRWHQWAEERGLALLLTTLEGPVGPGIPFERQPIRNAAAGGGEGVLRLLERFAAEAKRPELRDAPLLFWGISASGNFGSTFAMLYPERTLGLVRYHSHLRGLPVDAKVIRNIPMLLIAGGADATAGIEDSQRMWAEGRRERAPWTFLIQPGQQHGEGLDGSIEFMLAWMGEVIRLRVGESGLQRIAEENGWRGDNTTFDVAPATKVTSVAGTSWLPDERTVRMWVRLARAENR